MQCKPHMYTEVSGSRVTYISGFHCNCMVAVDSVTYKLIACSPKRSYSIEVSNPFPNKSPHAMCSWKFLRLVEEMGF